MIRSLRWAAAISLIANSASSLISALVIVVVVRGLSVSQWADAATLLGIGQFLGGALSFGTSTQQLRDLSLVSAQEFRRMAFLRTMARLTIGLLISFGGLLLMFAATSVGVVVLLCGGVFVSLGVTVPLIARRKYLAAGVLQLTEKLLAGIVVVCVSRTHTLNADTLPVSIGCSGLVAGCGVAAWAWRQSHGCRFRELGHAVVSYWHGSIAFGVATVAPSVLLLDVWVVSLAASPAAAGAYAVGSRLLAPLSVVATTVTQVLMPELAGRGRADFPRVRTARVAAYGLGIGAGIVALVLLAPPLAVRILGASYESARWPIIFFVLNAGAVLATRTLVTALQAWQMERIASALVACQVGVALVGIALGSALSGAGAAAASVFFSNLLLAALLVRVVQGRRRDFARQRVDLCDVEVFHS